MKVSAYLKVVVILLGHTVISWIIVFFSSKIIHSYIFSLIFPVLWGAVTGITFLFFFLHDQSFKTARDLEKQEKKIEERWLKKFSHSGKLFAVLAIGTVSGPILGALTIRLLMPRYKWRYFLVCIINVPSTFFYVFVVKSVLHAIIKA